MSGQDGSRENYRIRFIESAIDFVISEAEKLPSNERADIHEKLLKIIHEGYMRALAMEKRKVVRESN